MYERITSLIGENNLNKISNTRILLVGVGGVGGFAYEALIRSGFKDITIIDGDVVEKSNINRQLVATENTIDMKKTDIAYNHAKEINKDINITKLDIFLDSSNINDFLGEYDYIIDACDTIDAKVSLIDYAIKHNIKIISSMGMGNRIDATKVTITYLDKTCNDPLSKKLRNILRKNNIDIHIPVVWSSETPKKSSNISSLITIPAVAGTFLVNYIINDIINPY